MFFFNSKLNDSAEWNKSVGGNIIAKSHISIIQGGFQSKLKGETDLTSLCSKWTKNKVVSFLYYTIRGMNFHSCEKQIFKSFGCTKIYNDSKWNKASQNEVMQPATSNNDSRPIFPYHVHNQASFDNSFINGHSLLFTRAFPRWVSVFKYYKSLKVH